MNKKVKIIIGVVAGLSVATGVFLVVRKLMEGGEGLEFEDTYEGGEIDDDGSVEQIDEYTYREYEDDGTKTRRVTKEGTELIKDALGLALYIPHDPEWYRFIKSTVSNPNDTFGEVAKHCWNNAVYQNWVDGKYSKEQHDGLINYIKDPLNWVHIKPFFEGKNKL
jgi:hypothetical protein